uniref:Uncharacterized protein n=1 Tax=Picea sitchensis TaxID=3332 RepID=D5A968_PICSI|nr:unknown [Picea sitchensis]
MVMINGCFFYSLLVSRGLFFIASAFFGCRSLSLRSSYPHRIFCFDEKCILF